IGGVVVNFVLGFFIFAMLLFFYGESYFKNSDLKYGIAVDSIGMQLGLQDGDKLLTFGGKPVEKYDRALLVKEILLNDAKQYEVNRSGSEITLDVPENFVNILTAPENKNKSGFYPRIPMKIKEVTPNGLAQKAGLLKDDAIIMVNDKPTLFAHDFATEIRSHKNDLVRLTIVRSASENDKDTIIEQIQLDSTSTIGVQLASELDMLPISRNKYSFFQSLPAGVAKGVDFLSSQIKAFGQMFKGKMKAKDNLGSVVSMAKLFDSEWNWERFWTITAMLSIILAFFNILPIPALDGGYVLFLLWEIITGKKPTDRFMEIVTTAGFFILITLMIFALGLDINRLFK
nr:site-2 protease family protein [Saprospiraceae bacterium]